MNDTFTLRWANESPIPLTRLNEIQTRLQELQEQMGSPIGNLLYHCMDFDDGSCAHFHGNGTDTLDAEFYTAEQVEAGESNEIEFSLDDLGLPEDHPLVQLLNSQVG